MNNGREFWTSIVKWQGGVTEALKTIKENQEKLQDQLLTLQTDYWYMKGKMIAYGGIAGLVTSISIWIVVKYFFK